MPDSLVSDGDEVRLATSVGGRCCAELNLLLRRVNQNVASFRGVSSRLELLDGRAQRSNYVWSLNLENPRSYDEYAPRTVARSFSTATKA